MIAFASRSVFNTWCYHDLCTQLTTLHMAALVTGSHCRLWALSKMQQGKRQQGNATGKDATGQGCEGVIGTHL